jgi:hypothetical protein
VWLLARVVTQILPVFNAPSWLLRSDRERGEKTVGSIDKEKR